MSESPSKDERKFIRREFKREKKSLTARIQLPQGAGSVWDVVMVHDISTGGILFTYSHQKIRVGMRLPLILNFPPADRPLNMEIEIVRLELLPKSSVECVAARFVRINDDDRVMIGNYISEINRLKPFR